MQSGENAQNTRVERLKRNKPDAKAQAVDTVDTAVEKEEPPQERLRTDEELRQYKEETFAQDDAYASELRLQVGYYGEALLNRVKYEVDVLEREYVALSAVFNEFLDEVKDLDRLIASKTAEINKGKLAAAKQTESVIKQEIQTIVEQLRLLQGADLEGVEILYQNLDALQDNFELINTQIETLNEIGIKTDPIKKRIPALEKGINQFSEQIEKRQMELLVGEEEEETIDYDALRSELKAMIQSQSRAMINHLRQTQTLANPQEVEMIKRNQKGFEKSFKQITGQLNHMDNAGQETASLRALLPPIESALRQFERALSSNQFLKITERIYEQVEITNAQIKEAHQANNMEDIEVLEENVDILFDNCDEFADELDELTDQGHDISNVLEHYNVLRENVEQFERVVQDAANRVGLSSGQIVG